MIITVASGKGGTGKTTLAVNLAEYLKTKFKDQKHIRLLDCDVEAPNDKLFLSAEYSEVQDVEVLKPEWNKDNCENCGKCRQVCRYNAIARLPNKTLIFKDLCHSCGACQYVCPGNAITEEAYEIGKIHKSKNNGLDFIYGELNIGEIASPALVNAVKKNIDYSAVNIIDAPPGTGCSVVATLEGSDIAVLITEPTPFGLHDLKLAVLMTAKMKIPFGIVINRSDGNDKIITDYLDEHNIPLLGRIPFDRQYAEAYSNGKLLVEEFDEVRDLMGKIYAQCGDVISSPADLKGLFSETKELEIKDSELAEKFNNSEKTVTVGNKKEVMIISGKGGTGKTTISASFSYLAHRDNIKAVFEDCDVDAADLHLLLKPEVALKNDFSGGKLSIINEQACNGCGKCISLCRFDAIGLDENQRVKINELKCEGCGFCIIACPNSAIYEKDQINGQEFISQTSYGEMSHAELGIAEENSGKLVTRVRNNAQKLSGTFSRDLILGDGPPGSGCPVIASITGIDVAVIVTEPTMSGMHDMMRVLELAKHFKVKTKVIINKADLNQKIASKIKISAMSYDSEVIGEVTFDRTINEALMNGDIIASYNKGKACKDIEKAWNKLKDSFKF